jgi:hypothetical protein
MSLRRSTDRKTANLATPNGKTPAIANAFGLPSGRAFSCPGATSVCESVCYAGKLERLFPGMRAVMLANWDAIKDASYFEMRDMLGVMIAEFVADCDRRNAFPAFRIHHDGDFFSRDYAQAWADTVRAFPNVQFWVYTRSFTPGINVTDIIADIPNLAVYISVDTDNMRYARTIIDEFPSIRLASLMETSGEAAGMIRGIREDSRPGAKCPENVKQIPLITAEGGACFTCGICVTGKADVRFATKKK